MVGLLTLLNAKWSDFEPSYTSSMCRKILETKTHTLSKLFVMDGFEPSASAFRELFRCLLPSYPVSGLPLSYTTKWSRVLESNQSPPFCRGVITTSYVTRHLKNGAVGGTWTRRPLRWQRSILPLNYYCINRGAKCGNRTRLSNLQD